MSLSTRFNSRTERCTCEENYGAGLGTFDLVHDGQHIEMCMGECNVDMFVFSALRSNRSFHVDWKAGHVSMFRGRKEFPYPKQVISIYG